MPKGWQRLWTLLVVKHMACTECLDAYVLSGRVHVPADLVPVPGDTLSTPDILLKGRFPHDLIDPQSFFDRPSAFIINGKLIGTDSSSGSWRHAPVFYVAQWEAVK